MADQVANLYAKIGADDRGFNSAMDNMSKRVDGFGKTMSGIGNIVKVGMVGAVAGIAALGAGIGAATKSAATMEQQVADIRSVFGSAAPPAEELNKIISDLGLDPKLKVSATEAADSIEMLAKNGVTMAEITGGAAKNTVLLANATGNNFALAADVATDVMQQFNIAAGDMDKAVNGIVGVTQASKFSIDDYALAIAQGGGVAAAVGMTFEDFNATIAATSSSFGSGSDAGTSLKVFLQRLVPTTEKASGAMKDLGLLTADGASAFFDAAGNMRPMTDIAGELQRAFAGLSDAQRNEAASTIFGTDAMRTALALAEGGTDAIAKMQKLIGDTSAADAAATRMDTLGGDWEIFGGIMETLALGIGGKFIPVARQIVQWMIDVAQKWGPAVIDFFGRIADRVGAFVSNVGNTLTRLQGIFAVQFSILGSDNASWTEKMLAAWDMLYTVGMKIWQSLLDGILRLVPQWLNSLGEWALALWEWIKEATPKALAALWEWAKGLWGWLVENLPTWANNLWEWAKALWAWIVEVTPIAVQKLGEWATALWNYLAANLPIWINAFVTWGRATWQWLQDAVPIAIGKMGEWVSGVMNYLTANSPIWQAELLKWGRAAWKWLADVIPEVVLQVMVWAERVFEIIGANLPKLIVLMLSWGTALVNWIGEAAPLAILALANFVKGLRGEGDNTGANAIGQMVRGWAIKLWAWITEDAIPQIAPAFMQFLDAVMAAGGAIWDALVVLASEWGKTVNAWLVGMGIDFVTWKDIAIGAAVTFGAIFWPTISAAFGAVVSAIGGFLAAWAPVLAIFAAAVAASVLLRTAWETDWNGIRTHTLEALTFLGNAFTPLLDTIRQFGGQALQEIWAWATGNKTNFDATQKIWEAAKTAFTTVFTAIGAKLQEWGAIAWEWFQDKFPKAAAALKLAVDNIKRNFAELWEVAEPLIQQLQNAWARFTDDAEAEGGLFGLAMQRLGNLLDNVWTIMATSAGFTINTIINLFTLIIQLIRGDWTGAWTTFKQIIKGAWDTALTIVRSAVDGIAGLFGSSVDDVERYGREMIQGLWNGIREKWNSFTGWFQDAWDALLRRFKSFFGIHSPSTVFAGFGTSMMDGLAQGIDAAAGKVYSAMDSLGAGMNKTMMGMSMAPEGVFAPFVSLQEALGGKKSEEMLSELRSFASDADVALRKFGIKDMAILGHAFNLSDMTAAGSTASIGDIKSAIDAVVSQMNHVGLGSGATSQLSGASEYLGWLMTGSSGTSAGTAPVSGGGGMGDEMGRAILDMLAIIAEHLLKNGNKNDENLKVVRAYLSNIYAGGSNVANVAGLAR